jgi:hypothetical protein
MDNETQVKLLVSVLAATDSTWLPCRDPRSNSWINTHLARTSFRAGQGGRWKPLAGANEQQRKRRQRDLEQMSADGLLTLARRRESRLVGAELTAVGGSLARAVCGLPGWEAALASEDELRRLGDSEFAACEGNWISERGLAGCDYGDMDSAELVLVENLMLPSLVAGRVESLSDVAGRVWFRLTDAGGPDGPPNPTDVEPCGDLRDLYELELARHLDHFAQAKPQTRHEIGAIPLPCSLRTKVPA